MANINIGIAVNNVTTLTNLPVDKGTIYATLSAASNLSFASALTVGQIVKIVINPTATFTQTLPNTGDWSSAAGDTCMLTSGKKTIFTIVCYASGKYHIKSAEDKMDVLLPINTLVSGATLPKEAFESSAKWVPASGQVVSCEEYPSTYLSFPPSITSSYYPFYYDDDDLKYTHGAFIDSSDRIIISRSSKFVIATGFTKPSIVSIKQYNAGQTSVSRPFFLNNKTIMFAASSLFSGLRSFILNNSTLDVISTGNTLPDSNGISPGDVYNIAYGNNVYVASLASGRTYWSTDALNWTQFKVIPSPSGYSSGSVCFGNGKFVFVTFGVGAYYSTDGKNWTKGNGFNRNGFESSTGPFGNGMSDSVLYANGIYSSYPYWSSDGINWNRCETDLIGQSGLTEFSLNGYVYMPTNYLYINNCFYCNFSGFSGGYKGLISRDGKNWHPFYYDKYGKMWGGSTLRDAVVNNQKTQMVCFCNSYPYSLTLRTDYATKSYAFIPDYPNSYVKIAD